jgi:GT2 family glycosyltransferase
VTGDEQPRLAAVVVAFHAADDLDRCLAGLGRELDVVVVDNSSDPAVKAIADAHAAAYVDMQRNAGFAAAVNAGVAASDSSADLLLLNPDAVVAPSAVRSLHASLRADPSLAAVAPLVVGMADGAEQRVTWPWPSPAQVLAEVVGLSRLHRRRADFLIGAVLLLRREAWETVGGFDERFFLYSEEIDWQRRAATAGYQVRQVPEVTARHVGAGTSTDPEMREVLFHAGTETYIRKWHGARGWLVYRAAAVAGAAVRALVLPGPRRGQAALRMRIYLEGPSRRARRIGALPS